MKTDGSRKSQQTGWWHHFGATILFGSVAVAAYCVPWGNAHIEYSRHGIDVGEFWRLITCHWTHFSFDHFLWNLIPFVWLGALCEGSDRKGFVFCTIGSALAISLYVFIFIPELSSYRGLSGLDSALFGFLAVGRMKGAVRTRNRVKSLLLLVFVSLFVAKVGYETLCRAPLFVSDLKAGFVPVPGAHAVGFMVGAATALMGNEKSRIQSNSTGSGSACAVSRSRDLTVHAHSSPAARSTAL